MQHSPSTRMCPHALSPPQNTHLEALTGCRRVEVVLAGYRRVAIVHCSSSSWHSSRWWTQLAGLQLGKTPGWLQWGYPPKHRYPMTHLLVKLKQRGKKEHIFHNISLVIIQCMATHHKTFVGPFEGTRQWLEHHYMVKEYLCSKPQKRKNR